MKENLRYLFIVLTITGTYILTRVPDIGTDLTMFSTGFVILCFGYVGLINIGLPKGRVRWWLWFIVLTLCTRWLAQNMLPSDDIARYIWEGTLVREGFSPYSIPPNDPSLVYLRDDIVYPMINHKDMPAIYPPLTHLIFAVLTLITQTFNGFRVFIVLCELAAIALMFIWIRQCGLKRDRILIYVLNPLVIIGVAGQGHLDSLQILLIVASFIMWRSNRSGLAILLMMFAGMIKALALFALPFMLNRKTVRHLPWIVPLSAGMFLPFILLQGGLTTGNWGVYLGEFEYYSFTFAVFRFFAGTLGANIISAAIIFIAIFWMYLTRDTLEHSAAPMFTVVTLLGTTIHFWYLAPLLAMAVVWRMRSIVVLSLLFLPYFFVYGDFTVTGEWTGELWRQIFTWSGFLLFVYFEWSGRRRLVNNSGESVGVVIPVLNDGEHLTRLIQDLKQTGIPERHVVISDAGSEDRSVEFAKQSGCQVVESLEAGRGNQICKGMEHLDTQVVVVLHADNHIPANLIEIIRKTASAYPDTPGGACRLSYEGSGIKTRLLTLISNSKTAMFGLSFGDQAQWFRRERVEYPAMPLMEDVELSMRMNNAGRCVYTPVTVSVSTRRYSNLGAKYVFITTIRRTLSYLFQRRWRLEVPDTRRMYEDYYGREIVPE